jgi:hypothetical protein
MTPSYLPATDRLIRQQFDRVVQLADEFDIEATRCAEAGAFDAACVMIGCALEALLLANVLAFEPDMEHDGTWAPSSTRPPEEWHLPELVKFHREQGWIAGDDPASAKLLGEAVEALNDLRNVVAHPGRLIREALEFDPDERIFEALYAVLQGTFTETAKLYELPPPPP